MIGFLSVDGCRGQAARPRPATWADRGRDADARGLREGPSGPLHQYLTLGRGVLRRQFDGRDLNESPFVAMLCKILPIGTEGQLNDEGRELG